MSVIIGYMPETSTDTSGKPERIRLIVDTEEAIRAAVRLRALKTGQDNSEVVNEILRKALADEIAEVNTYPQFGGHSKPRRKPRAD